MGKFEKYIPRSRLGRTLMGLAMILLGIIGIVLPLISFWLFPLGLAILAADYAWARYMLNKTRDGLTYVRRKVDGRRRAGRH